MILDTKIKYYYYNNLTQLPTDKQFHFATRMAAWNGDSKAFELLRELKSTVVDNPNLRDTFQKIASTPQSGRRNAHELRQPFFEKYPLLYGAHSALFRLRHLKSVYGIDVRSEFFDVFDKAQLDTLCEQLQNDAEALKVLSTFAVNFIYLYKMIALQDISTIDPNVFLQAAKTYDVSKPVDMQLKIYLYTHCIIGESNFYTQKIESKNLETYATMLGELQELIVANFDVINLDNKLEFLVSCRIINFETSLFEQIDVECQKSISSEGDFVIDTHNQNAQDDKTSFDKSEHRNVLYIMSASSYEPHSTIID